MRVLKIADPTHIQLPAEVRECPGLKQGDVVVMRIETDRVIFEKQADSPVDASFGLWADLLSSPTYVDTLRDEWGARLTEPLSNG